MTHHPASTKPGPTEMTAGDQMPNEHDSRTPAEPQESAQERRERLGAVCGEVFGWGASPAAVKAEPQAPALPAQSEREAIINQMCQAMRPLAKRHDDWYGWPGTWAFASAAMAVIEARAALAASPQATPPAAPDHTAMLREVRRQLADFNEGAKNHGMLWQRGLIKRIDTAIGSKEQQS